MCVSVSLLFPKSISEMLGFSFSSFPRGALWKRSLRNAGAEGGNSRGGGYGGAAWLERSLRNAGAEDAEVAGEEATEELRCWNGRCGTLGLRMRK